MTDIAGLVQAAQAFVDRKYVARSDERQKSMGLAYVEAERQDLAKEIARFAATALSRMSVAPVAWRWKYREDEAWQHCSSKYTPPSEAITEALGVIAAPIPARTGGEDECSCGGGDLSGHDAMCPYAPQDISARRETVARALTSVVLAIAFLGRDAGTERLSHSLQGIIAELAKADKELRAILAAL